MNYKEAKLNEQEKETLKQCQKIAAALAEKHSLPFKEVMAIECDAAWGMCSIDGILKLTLYKLLPTHGLAERWTIDKEEVLRTLAHEIAHLKHFNHGAAFWEFANQLKKDITELTGIKLKREQNCYRR